MFTIFPFGVILGDSSEVVEAMRSPFIEMEADSETVTAKEGEAVTFMCRVGGHPQPRLVFYKDQKRLRPNENVKIGKYKIEF